MVAEELDHRPRRHDEIPCRQEVEKRDARRRFPAEAAGAVDRKAGVAVRVGSRDEAEVLPQRESLVRGGGQADLDLAREFEGDIPVEDRIGQETRIGGLVAGTVRRDAAAGCDRDVPERVAAAAAVRQAVGCAGLDDFDRIERRHTVELDVLPGRDMDELRAAPVDESAQEPERFRRNFAAGEPDPVHEFAVALLIDAERGSERFHRGGVQFAGREFPKRAEQVGLRLDDVFEIHREKLLLSE